MHLSNLGLIWGIAVGVLRDIFVRGHYRDVILPMVVLRRLDMACSGAPNGVHERKNQLIQYKLQKYGLAY